MADKIRVLLSEVFKGQQTNQEVAAHRSEADYQEKRFTWIRILKVFFTRELRKRLELRLPGLHVCIQLWQ